MGLLDGNVLVTGATGGIGQAIARAFARKGASLILTGRRADVLEPLTSEVDGRAIACDLSRREDVDRLLGEVGEVDVLVANAGLPATGALTDASQADIDRMLEVNLRAPIALARGLAPEMISRRRGHMVFISSLSGKASSPETAFYCATKFGLRGFALAIREDLRPHGVGASVVLPGFIREAGMFAVSGVELPRGVGTKTPDEVAEAVLRAVERNRAEVGVAPLWLRVGADFASVAPEITATVSRWMGSEKVASGLAAAERARR